MRQDWRVGDRRHPYRRGQLSSSAQAEVELDVDALDGFEADALAGSVHLRFEGLGDLRGLLQHHVGVELLLGFNRVDVDAQVVAEATSAAAARRLVASGRASGSRGVPSTSRPGCRRGVP